MKELLTNIALGIGGILWFIFTMILASIPLVIAVLIVLWIID